MADWAWSPRYALLLKKGDGSVWNITTMQSAQALLVTGQGVSQMSAVLADPSGYLRRVVQPHPMNLIELWLSNRHGQSGLAWRGYVDEAHRAFDPDQGDNVTLSCTGPVKLFEITRQSPGDVASLAVAYAQNVTGSAVLTFAAKACGYPLSMLRIHPAADSGSGFQQIGADVFTNPDQQAWSSVVSAIQANSGTEFFFDEGGFCYWRQLGMLDPWFSSGLPGDPPRPAKIRPRTISEDDILQGDFAESDAGVVTDVEVRYYGGGGYTQTAVHWPRSAGAGGGAETAAHKSMVKHLRTRRLVVYAPWILNSAAAQYLADVLGAQYSAGVAQASLTIPADPLVRIGSLVDVPAIGVGGTTRYYVSSITYLLAWGGGWNMTLGLSYGRAPNQSFPYAGTVGWPQVTSDVRAGEALPGPVASLDATNPAWDTTPYNVVAQAGLATDQAATAAYQPGAVIQVYGKPRSQGGLLGPAPTGEYTVVAPTNPAQSQTTIALASTKQSTGYVTIISLAPPPPPSAAQPAVPGFASYDPTGTSTATGADGPQSLDPAAQLQGSSPALRALNAALTLNGKPYIPGHAGEDGWDCSGLVSWAFAQVGINCGFIQGSSGVNADQGPGYIYDYFVSLGAGKIDVSQAQPGDLLFINNGQATQGGFHHVCFSYSSTQNFGGDNESWGVCLANNAGFTDTGAANGTPLNRALDMSTVDWGKATRI